MSELRAGCPKLGQGTLLNFSPFYWDSGPFCAASLIHSSKHSFMRPLNMMGYAGSQDYVGTSQSPQTTPHISVGSVDITGVFCGDCEVPT